jgi:transcriptional regulator with XRE-family HTH domain
MRVQRPPHNRFGRLIASLRKRIGYTQSEIAAILGITSNYLSKIETGEKGVPSSYILIKMADFYNIKLSRLMVAGGIMVKSMNPDKLDNVMRELKDAQAVENMIDSAKTILEIASVFENFHFRLPADVQELANPLKLQAKTLLQVLLDSKNGSL